MALAVAPEIARPARQAETSRRLIDRNPPRTIRPAREAAPPKPFMVYAP
jgi:hypothetical protein